MLLLGREPEPAASLLSDSSGGSERGLEDAVKGLPGVLVPSDLDVLAGP